MDAQGPQQLPDPWLFDSEALLRELDRCRELTLQIPTNGDCNATHFSIQIAVYAQWNLRENLRHLLHLHREQQRAIRREHEQSLSATLSQPASTTNANVVPLHAPAPTNGKTPNKIARTRSQRERFAKRRRASSVSSSQVA